MTATHQKRTPKLRHHKATGQALVELDGRRIYLGRWDLPEARQNYHRLIAEWIANGRQLPIAPDEITVTELVARFWRYACDYYRKPDGTPTNEQDNLRLALRPLTELYGNIKASDFGPRALKAIRQRMIDGGGCRTYINNNIGRIKLVFKWAVAEELVAPSVYHGLQAVSGLKRGRSLARESDPIRPVAKAHIAAVREHVSRQVWSLIQLQLLAGARPGELVGLRGIDIDTSESVWTATLRDHKTAHHGRGRTLYFGPTAKMMLQTFMAGRPVDSCLFSPCEAERERYNQAKVHRQPRQTPNPKTTVRKLGDRYSVSSYRRAIHRACEKAGVPQWSPHRLRHNTASRLRREYGIDVAQTILGHRLGSGVTEVYAEANVAKAIEIIGKVG